MIKFRSLTPQSLRTFALATAVSLGAGAGAFAPLAEAEAGHPPVVCAKLKEEVAQKHCAKDNSFSAMRKAMKKAQSAYNSAKGQNTKCGTCHKDGNDGGALVDGYKKHWDGGFKAELEKNL